ncbi:heavy-metal-associated domain-containing protein [Candidatus Magnetaquicoccus inordinatus]|uniref:heavy-metal-associated domain-containing protein n=1 Tax=Candidatus Magnetaquicoccus inordinatus TaxID=2496818 RepID=UPI00187D2F21|nr:heavy-metal-associated domain-containing protein [Candidatus Magnetaquicoccus inordinatus]
MSCIQHSSRKPYLVSHSLYLDRLAEGMDIHSVKSRLLEVQGVASVECEQDAEQVLVTYDLRQLHLEEIETSLRSMGLTLKDDLVSHLRHAVSHFLEELEDDEQSAEMNKPDHAHNPFLYRNVAEEKDPPV